MHIYVFQGCEPYRVPPCPVDDDGHNTCAGKPMEKNHRCTRKCYGEQNLDYDSDHKYSMNYFDNVYDLQPKTFLNILI